MPKYNLHNETMRIVNALDLPAGYTTFFSALREAYEAGRRRDSIDGEWKGPPEQPKPRIRKRLNIR